MGECFAQLGPVPGLRSVGHTVEQHRSERERNDRVRKRIIHTRGVRHVVFLVVGASLPWDRESKMERVNGRTVYTTVAKNLLRRFR